MTSTYVVLGCGCVRVVSRCVVLWCGVLYCVVWWLRCRLLYGVVLWCVEVCCKVWCVSDVFFIRDVARCCEVLCGVVLIRFGLSCVV